MKNYLLKLIKSNVQPLVLVTRPAYLQLAQSKSNHQHSNSRVVNKRSLFSVCLGVFITLFCLIAFEQSKAQITDTSIFPLNEYLYTTSSNPYPAVNNDKINAIDKSRFVNVMDYGAKGDGVTLDDNAIATAFKAAQYGVIFPSGKTFLVSKLSTIILTHDLTVSAYGATIKMASFTRYSFLSLESLPGSYYYKVIWLGGTLNGNKDKQSWPGSPTGNNAWEEAHGRFVGVSNAEFVLFKDVKVINTVVDGIGIESCKLGVIADSKASGGARIQYSEVQEQGTYFKFTRVGLKTCYFLNLTCSDGSIGTHISYPENAIMDNETLSVHVNCRFYNQVQNAVHIEDCYKNFFYNCTFGADTGYQYRASIHLSNNTGIASVRSCQFKNARINFNNASSLKLGIIDSCQFTSTYKGFGSPLSMFIEGRPTVCINSSFDGRTALKYQAYLKNVRNCTFSNFDSLAIQGGYAVDSCKFITGTRPANLAKGGFVISSTYIGVKDTLFKSKPVDNEWKKTYLSFIDILSNDNKYLGRITCGGIKDTANQKQLVSKAVTGATAQSKNTAHNTFSYDSSTHPSFSNALVIGIDNSNVIASQQVKLYPNPAVNEVHVTLNNKVWGKTVLTIYDQQGRLVQTKTVYKNTAASVETINVNTLTSGAYVLQILNERQTSSLKFIVAK